MLTRYCIPIVAVLTIISVQEILAKSAAGSFWRSLFLPGWGQYYSGASPHRFLWTEALLWGGYRGLMKRADFRSDRFRSFAREHSGADLRNKPREFLDDVGFYESRSQHDQYALYEDGPPAVIYGLDTGDDWHWDNELSRQTYRNLRNKSRHSRRQALYLVGGLVASRIFSAIHAARLHGRPKERSAKLSIALVSQRFSSMELSVVKRF